MRSYGAGVTSRRVSIHRFAWMVQRWRLWAPVPMVVLCASVAAFYPAGRVAADGYDSSRAGTIEGQVSITRKLTSQRMRFRLYPGFKPLPPPTGEENQVDERRNVVIYLESAPSLPAAPVPDEHPQIAQTGETFVPHVLPIVKGTTVDFPNQDPIFHNVFSLSGGKSFDLGRYPRGDSRSVTFDQSRTGAGILPFAFQHERNHSGPGQFFLCGAGCRWTLPHRRRPGGDLHPGGLARAQQAGQATRGGEIRPSHGIERRHTD